MTTLPLSQRLLIFTGELSRRSDVIVERQAFWSGPVGTWKKTLPEDLLSLYHDLNGFCFQWRFSDSKELHGFRLLALEGNGKGLIAPDQRRLSIPLTKAKSFPGGLKDEQSKPWPATDEVALFEGDSSSTGVVYVPSTGKFYQWSNDGALTPITDSFTKLIEQGMSCGFASTWRTPDHPNNKVIQERLSKPAPLRETFRLEVISRKDISATQYRETLSETVAPTDFDKMMKSLKRTEAHKSLKPKERAALFASLTGDLESKTAPQLSAISKAIMPRRKKPASKEELTQMLRSGLGGVAEVTIKITSLTKATVMMESYTLMRALQGAGLQVMSGAPLDANLLAVCYPPKFREYWTPFIEEKETKRWKKGEAEYTVLLVEENARGLTEGAKFTSTGLPDVMSNIGC